MRDIVIEYDALEEQKLWESFVIFFQLVKGYSDWTIDDIALSMNNDDIEEYCKWVKKVLGE